MAAAWDKFSGLNGTSVGAIAVTAVVVLLATYFVVSGICRRKDGPAGTFRGTKRGGVVIIGPSGSGKTVLLHRVRAKRQCIGRTR